MAASWPITKHVKAYCILFLLLETGMLGVFLALDFFLFYVFWEVMLLPMYFLIGVWGGPRREYAAIKFFLYTLVGSVLMLIAILMLYFTSDLRAAGRRLRSRGTARSSVSWSELHRPKQPPSVAGGSDERRPGTAHVQHPGPGRTWASTPSCSTATAVGKSLQWWAFLLLFIGFVIKVPIGAAAHLVARRPRRGPHADLDDPGRRAVEDGRLRHHPHLLSDLSRRPATTWRGSSAALGVVSMVYGAFAALAQKDFKRLVAYSSVSHMGYVRAGHRRLERDGRQPVTTPTTGRWA